MSIDLAALAKETAERMNKVAKQAYAPVKPVRIFECFLCCGFGYDEDGSRCFRCAGKGKVATDADYEI